MVKVYLKVLQVWFYWTQKCSCHRYNSKNNNNNKCLLLLGWMLWKSLSSGSKNCASSLSQIVDDDKTWEREKKNIRQLDYFLFTFLTRKNTQFKMFFLNHFLCVKLKHKSFPRSNFYGKTILFLNSELCTLKCSFWRLSWIISKTVLSLQARCL